MKIPFAERLLKKDQGLERKMVIAEVDVIETKKKDKREKRNQVEDERTKRKMVKTGANVSEAYARSKERFEFNSMYPYSYSNTDTITLEFQSQNRLYFPALARECDRYGISDRAADSIASAVLQDIGNVYERDTSHAVDHNET